ncbi:hypothetical protein V5O48_006867 [Marasmius crinis-equi]|uniref:Chitin-binding type-4 domain-containing protein n=1 Tax=Marasmius crinis-equi TaxID=585013 RepID=A0ABR3FIC0_9AGAR
MARLTTEPRGSMVQLLVLTLAALFARTSGHADVESPTPRRLGDAFHAACGDFVYGELTKDLANPIEGAANRTDSGYHEKECHLWFCRGAQYEDNINNTRVYKPGDVVPFHVDIKAHHTGWANVSVVDLQAQTPIARLFTWPVYANESLGPPDWPKNESDFSVTIPDLGTKCSQPNACAIQWWWYSGFSNHQTYMNCVDFTQ